MCVFDWPGNRNRSIFADLLRPEYVFIILLLFLKHSKPGVFMDVTCTNFLLRFRFVKGYKTALSSDALSGFPSGCDVDTLNENVLGATVHLRKTTIPNFSTKLCENLVNINAKYLYSKQAPYTPLGWDFCAPRGKKYWLFSDW